MAEVDFVMLRDDVRFIKPKHAHKNRNRTISVVKIPCPQSSSRRPTADRGVGELWARDWGGTGKDPGIGWSRVHLTPPNPGCNKLAS